MRFFSLFLILNIPLLSIAQRIKNVNLYLANSTVNIKFTLSAGASCDGYKVLRSLDSLFYNEIYNYSGICGTSGVDENFSALDANPAFNQVNYYKIQLSTFETSEAKGIYVSNANSASMLVYPNPVTNVNDPVNLKLYNANNINVAGYLYDEYGFMLQSLNLYTTGEQTSINAGLLRNGIYLIWLTDGAVRYSCKFVVLQ